jgi:hypothetical protein
MDELVKLVVQKTGLPEATARTTVQTVIDFIKKRLPEPLAGQVDAVIAGADLSQADDLLKGLGGILGKQ